MGISLALILLPLVSSDPPSNSTFSVFCLPGHTIGLPGAEILFWERFVLDHEVWKRLLLSVPGPLQKRSQLQQWLKVLCCGGFSLLLIGTESEHGTTCFSIWPFPIRTTGKILIAGPCASRFVSNNSRPNSDKNLKMRKEDEKIRQKMRAFHSRSGDGLSQIVTQFQQWLRFAKTVPKFLRLGMRTHTYNTNVE